MKTLPPEIWTMIAHHTKRPQPPPKVKANWNDNFNQQDLVSLMLVDRANIFSLGYSIGLMILVDVQDCRPCLI